MEKESTFQLSDVQLLGVDSNSGNGDGSNGKGGRKQQKQQRQWAVAAEATTTIDRRRSSLLQIYAKEETQLHSSGW